MSRAVVVRNTASVCRDAKKSTKVVKVNPVEVGNVQSIPVRRTTASTPKDIANARLYRTQADQSDRITELETQLQNLWQQYAGSRKQKLDLLDANSSLESEICSLKKELAYETRMRGVAEAKLDAADYEPPN